MLSKGACFCPGSFLSRVFARPWAAPLLGGSGSCFSFPVVLCLRPWLARMWFRHESCIRRGCRHEPLLIGCRIHPETCLPVRRVFHPTSKKRSVGTPVSRLAEPGRTCLGRVDPDGSRHWRVVGLLFAQHPIASLGEMAGDGDDGTAMSLAWRGAQPPDLG